MAYGSKYKLTFRTYFNELCEVYIKEDGYAGAVTNVYGTGDPLEITWETPSDFLLDPVNGSAATIRLMSTTDQQFVNLFTANNRKYQLQVDIDAATKWIGFLDPDYYQEAYTSPPYPVEFVATDQLGYLKNLDWDKTGSMTLLSALWTILNRTDLELDLYEGINLYEEAHDAGTTDSPLDQTFFDADVYEGKTYYDALEDILLKFGAVLRQSSGAWTILRPVEMISNSAVIRLWDWGGSSFTINGDDTLDSIGGILATTTPTAASIMRLGSDMSMFVRPAWQSYKIVHDYGKKDNILENGDFTGWNGLKPYNWVLAGSASTYVSRAGDKLRLLNTPYSYIGTFVGQIMSSTVDIYKFSVDYSVSVPAGLSMTVIFSLNINTKSWDFDTNTWGNSLSKYRRTFDNTTGTYAMVENISVDITTNDSGITPTYVSVNLYPPVCPFTSFMEVDSVSLRMLKETSATDIGEYPESEEYETEINPNNNYRSDDINLYCADYGINLANLSSIYNGVLFSDSLLTTRTLFWSPTGAYPWDTLIGHLQSSVSGLFSKPQQVLTGSVHTRGLTPVTTIQETYNSNKLHYMKRAAWDIKNGTWNIEAPEILGSTNEFLLQEIGDKILQETGDSIII